MSFKEKSDWNEKKQASNTTSNSINDGSCSKIMSEASQPFSKAGGFTVLVVYNDNAANKASKPNNKESRQTCV